MKRNLTVLYGSQTGTAQDLAEHVWRDSKKYYFKGSVQALNDYDPKRLLDEEFVVFVCSTTGQGVEPDNMKSFWKFLLRKNLPKDSLNGVYFSVLGLGDSSYSKYNFVAKRLNKRLLNLGGNLLMPVGLCDDQHDLGISAVFVPWLDELWNKLLFINPVPSNLPKLIQSPRQYRWNVNVSEVDTESRIIDEDNFDMFKESDSNLITTNVLANERTTAENHFQDVRLITFDMKELKWAPGDVLCIKPRNSDEMVEAMFNLFEEHSLNLKFNTLITIEEFDSEFPVPVYLQKKLTLGTIARQYWDLNAIPRTRVFELLAQNCTDVLEKEKLIEFTTPAGQEDLFAYVNRPRRTILEVMNDFRHATATLNLQLLFEIFQPIKPRYFSIASAMESEKLQLLVAVVEYKTKLKKPRIGLCSNYLKNLKVGDKLNVKVGKGTLKLPDIKTPLAMVGPGTGLAPFRSILQSRQELIKAGKAALFFGCRNENADFHCKDELLNMQTNGLSLFCAFSRDQEDKVYVQHKIKEYGSLLKDILQEKGGYFLVSGSSKNMPDQVKSSLQELFDDPNYLDELIKKERYQEETW